MDIENEILFLCKIEWRRPGDLFARIDAYPSLIAAMLWKLKAEQKLQRKVIARIVYYHTI